MDQPKEKSYEDLLKQLDHLTDKELDVSTNICNVLAVLKEARALFWVGVYYAKPDKLVLGPYQGGLPCFKIKYGEGLCGQAASQATIQCVNDVNTIENYIACHAETQAEIVIPGYSKSELAFVLDIDSTLKNAFDETDQHYLTKVANHLGSILENN